VAGLRVCVCVCLLVMFVSPAKTAEPTEMMFGALTRVDPRNHVLDVGQGRTNPFAAARGDKMVMRPFVKIL